MSIESNMNAIEDFECVSTHMVNIPVALRCCTPIKRNSAANEKQKQENKAIE